MKKELITCDNCRKTIPANNWGSADTGFRVFGLIRDANGAPIVKDKHTYEHISADLCSLQCLKDFVKGIKIPKLKT